MAMITCKECGTDLSSTASSCPKCGAKQTANLGRNVMIGLFAVVALIGIIIITDPRLRRDSIELTEFDKSIVETRRAIDKMEKIKPVEIDNRTLPQVLAELKRMDDANPMVPLNNARANQKDSRQFEEYSEDNGKLPKFYTGTDAKSFANIGSGIMSSRGTEWSTNINDVTVKKGRILKWDYSPAVASASYSFPLPVEFISYDSSRKIALLRMKQQYGDGCKIRDVIYCEITSELKLAIQKQSFSKITVTSKICNGCDVDLNLLNPISIDMETFEKMTEIMKQRKLIVNIVGTISKSMNFDDIRWFSNSSNTPIPFVPKKLVYSNLESGEIYFRHAL